MYPRLHVSAMLQQRLRNVKPSKRDFSWSHISRLLERQQFNLDELERGLLSRIAKHFELVISQRVRQTIKIIKIWNNVNLRELRRAWNHKKSFFNRRQLLIATTLLTPYNWDSKRISDREMYSCCNDINEVYRLRDSTVICPKCRLRLIIDIVQPEVTYCECKDVTHVYEPHEWEPFIERNDMLVWRKIESDTNGLYAYKVYGSFEDVTAEDFLQVQINVDYRKEWDHTAKELTILETDPQNVHTQDGACDIIYWEMIWPTLFANRDYVYQRRWVLDKEKGIIIIISKATEHPNAPVRSNTHRVSSYWSYMVIKPYQKFNENGIEFTLTYFDDPGVNLSYAITSWVAMRGFPDYLCKMREASKQYKAYKLSKGEIVSVPESVNDRNNLETESTENETNVTGNNLNDNIETDKPNKQADSNDEADPEESNVDNKSECIEPAANENQGFFSYFFISRLFA